MSIFKKLAHLPVMSIGSVIADHFASRDDVTLVSSETGTGRTLLVPQFCAQKLDWAETIYVLLPSRIMARNAAMNARSLMDAQDKDLIGYRCSVRDGETPIIHEDNRIVYTTVGYALSTKLLMRESNFIIDEAHDTTTDILLTKAILKYRRDNDAIRPRVLLMSATFDVEQENQYWGDDCTKSFYVSGQLNPITFMEGDIGWGDAIEYLVGEVGCTGILIFTAGGREQNAAISQIRRHIQYSRCAAFSNQDYELYQVSGSSTYEERSRALAPPRSKVKIVVTTKILEASVSLPWVNGGASSGNCIVVRDINGVSTTDVISISRSRIVQQAGRTNRFGPGTFILNSPVSFESRPLRDAVDTEYGNYDDLCLMAFHQSLSPIDDLQFMPSEAPSKAKLNEGIARCHRLGLVERNRSGWDLTDDGQWVLDMNLHVTSGAFACQARRMNILPAAIPMIARLEIPSLMFNKGVPLDTQFCPSSDLVNEICSAFDANGKSAENRKIYEEYNLNYKNVRLLFTSIESCERLMHMKAWTQIYTPSKKSFVDLDSYLPTLKTCLAFVFPERFYQASVLPGVVLGSKVVSLAQSSAMSRSWEYVKPAAVIGQPIEIRPRDRSHRPFVIIAEATLLTNKEKEYVFTHLGRSLFTSYIGK